MKNAQPSAGDLHGVKGRRTIRPNADSAHVGLWSMKTTPGSTAHRLEQVYLKALSNVDAISARKSEASKSGQFTPSGLKADTLKFAAEKRRTFIAGGIRSLRHPGVLAAVQELERGIELAERAIELGKGEVIKEAETSPQQFDELAAPYLKNSNIAWLRKTGDAVKTVDLRRGVTRDATPEELANGMHFADYNEYAAANGLPVDKTGA